VFSTRQSILRLVLVFRIDIQHADSSVKSISMDMTISGRFHRESGSGQLVNTIVQETMFILEMG
jgi:hypothetical protein